MLRSLTLLALLCTTGLVAQDLQTVLTRHFKAMGGVTQLKGKTSLSMTMRMMGGGLEAPVEVESLGDDRVRVEVDLGGPRLITAVSGDQGWKVDPLEGYGGGVPEPVAMTPEEVRQSVAQRNYRSELLEPGKGGHRLEYAGMAKVEGTSCHVLKLAHRNGDHYTLYLDGDAYLLVKQVVRTKVNGMEQIHEVKLGDYKPVEGILVAHTMEFQPKGAPVPMTFKLDKVTFNEPVEPARFLRPRGR